MFTLSVLPLVAISDFDKVSDLQFGKFRFWLLIHEIHIYLTFTEIFRRTLL